MLVVFVVVDLPSCFCLLLFVVSDCISLCFCGICYSCCLLLVVFIVRLLDVFVVLYAGRYLLFAAVFLLFAVFCSCRVYSFVLL